MKYPNKIMSFMEGRTQVELARRLCVERAAFHHWVKGQRRPNKYIMADFLEILGEPLGRALEFGEVWQDACDWPTISTSKKTLGVMK